jgi:hypothetical protein
VIGWVNDLFFGGARLPKDQDVSQGDWSSPDEGTWLDPRRAEPWCSAGQRLGAFIGLTGSSNRWASIFSGESVLVFREPRPTIGAAAPPLTNHRSPITSFFTNGRSDLGNEAPTVISGALTTWWIRKSIATLQSR